MALSEQHYIIRMLLEHGADTTVRSRVGETAVDWARKSGLPLGLELLKASPRDVARAVHLLSPSWAITDMAAGQGWAKEA